MIKALPKPHKYLALSALLTGAFLPPLDFYAVNLALPSIEHHLQAKPSEIQLIISLYASAYAVFLITGGRLGDLIGRKKMFMLGLAGFIASSSFCGFATDSGILILGRILQGISGAILAPQVISIIRVLFSEKEQPFAMGLYSFTFGLAAVAGQLLGAALIRLNLMGLGWQSIFLINIPVGIFALSGSAKYLPEQRGAEKTTIDYLGVLLLSITLGLLVYPLTRGQESIWPLWTFISALLSIPCGGLFIAYENHLNKKGKIPLVDFRLFKNHHFNLGLIICLLFYSSSIFYLAFALLLQDGMGWDAWKAGLAILPFGIGFISSSLYAAPLSRYTGDQILNIGLLCYVFGFAVLALLLHKNQIIGPAFYAGLMACGTGMGLIISSLVRIILKWVEIKLIGLASGLISSTLQIGAAIGVAAIGSIFFKVLGQDHSLKSYSLSFQYVLWVLVVLQLIAFATGLVLIKSTK
eukprot:gene14665-17342_t